MNAEPPTLIQDLAINMKIVVLGEGGVGKTSLIKSYIEETPVLSTIHTVAVDFHTKEFQMDNKNIILQIWDLGGQRQFRNMGMFHTYSKDSQGALLCFDLTKSETFFELSEWLKFIEADDIPKILVGTKLDKSTYNSYLKTDIIKFCKQNNIIGYRKTTVFDNYSIQLLFKELIFLIFQKQAI